MDPDTTLTEIRKLKDRLLQFDIEDDVTRLVELVEALDEWLSADGYLPFAWSKARERRD